jgi:hypothetical protein
MIENLNKVTEEVQFSMRLYSYLCDIHVRMVGAHNDYNVIP